MCAPDRARIGVPTYCQSCPRRTQPHMRTGQKTKTNPVLSSSDYILCFARLVWAHFFCSINLKWKLWSSSAAILFWTTYKHCQRTGQWQDIVRKTPQISSSAIEEITAEVNRPCQCCKALTFHAYLISRFAKSPQFSEHSISQSEIFMYLTNKCIIIHFTDI